MKTFFRIVIIAALLGAAYYGYRQYQLRGSSPKMVWVQTGEQITCIGCGKVLSRDVKEIRVPVEETRRYRIRNLQGVCEACRKKGVQ